MAQKTLKKDKIFSLSTIYNSIDTFEYVPENDKVFEAFYRRYEDIFNIDCEEWPRKKGTSTIKKTGNNRTW